MVYVLLALLVLLILIIVLLNISVTLKAHYDDEKNVFQFRVHYLFFTYVITPEEEKKKKKSRKKDKTSDEKKDKTTVSQRIKDRGIRGFLEDMKTIVSSVWTLIVAILKRAVLQKFTLRLTVVGEDAADTAVIYGYANAVVYPIVSALIENVDRYNELDVDIRPDFSEEAQAKVEFNAVAKMKPSKFIAAVIESRSSAEKLISAINRKPKDKVKNSKENAK